MLIWTPFIGRFVHPVGGKGWGKEIELIVIVASSEHHFIKVYDGNLAYGNEHPSDNISITRILLSYSVSQFINKYVNS